MLQLVLLKDGIIDRQDSAAGIPENGIDALIHKRLDDDLRAVHLLISHPSVPRLITGGCCIRMFTFKHFPQSKTGS